MKTENIVTSDPVWAANVELLSNEECLPIIGNYQMSSILQNLETNSCNGEAQNMDLIILHTSDYKLPAIHNSTSQQISPILKENTKSNESSKEEQIDFLNITYFLCNFCPYLCTQGKKMTEHLDTVHKDKPLTNLFKFKCPACGNMFYHKQSLRSHLSYDHSVSNSDLVLIMQAFTFHLNNAKKLTRASEDHNKNVSVKIVPPKTPSLPVKTCEKDVIGENVNRPNISVNNSLQKVVLPQVDITQSSTFNSFMDKTEDNVNYNSRKCPHDNCKVSLVDDTKLAYHIRCHSDEASFTCPECREKFTFWKTLSSHLWHSHKIDMELFSCDKCNYKTYSLARLNNIHKLIHSDVKAYKCDKCDKAFKNNKQLRNHKEVHKEKVDKTTVTCTYCAKVFCDKRSARAHTDVVHKKIKPFLCSFCGYKGSSKSSLQMHLRSHTGEKPFACSECPYVTGDHNSLRRHKLRHSGQKPYKCSYCTYSCIQSSTYKVHMRTKHPGLENNLMFTCHSPNCQFRTVNKDKYKLHIDTAHNPQ